VNTNLVALKGENEKNSGAHTPNTPNRQIHSSRNRDSYLR
jgi:hypothetical protein